MSKALLFLKRLLPRPWWLMLLNMVAGLRCRFGRRDGETQVWFWDDKDYAVLSRERCQRLLDEEFLPLFEHAARSAPKFMG